MDTADELESKIENLMNIVVESRKRFGKTCIEYDQKILLVENKLLNVLVETVSCYRFKPKNSIPDFDDECNEEVEDLVAEIVKKQKRIEDLKRDLKTAQEVVSQMDNDGIGKKLRAPLTAEALLAKAKAKNL